MSNEDAAVRYEKLIESPIGPLTAVSSGEALNELRFGDCREGGDSCAVLEQTAVELGEYFSGVRREFSVPFLGVGTPFQRAVWQVLCSIPYGETASYADIAAKIGKKNACRAVGGANNRNPLPIIVPCHRVIGKNGALTGYAGGLEIKEFLLKLEQEHR